MESPRSVTLSGPPKPTHMALSPEGSTLSLLTPDRTQRRAPDLEAVGWVFEYRCGRQTMLDLPVPLGPTMQLSLEPGSEISASV